MNPLLTEQEISTGYGHGEVDINAWISSWGLGEAIEKADNRLSTLMIENSVSDLNKMPAEVPPYIIGLMRAYDEFLSRHCSVSE